MAVGGIVVCVPVNVFGGNNDEFVDNKEDKRLGSLSVFGIGVGIFDKADDCRGPRTLVLFRLTLFLPLRRTVKRSFSR